jgi:hypothetical protein
VCEYGLLMGTLKDAAFDGPPAHDATARAKRGYIPIGLIAPAVAECISGISQASLKDAGKLLPKTDDEAYHNEDAAAPGASGAVHKVESVGAMTAPTPEDATLTAGGEEDEAVFATSKKKKKATKAAAEEEEED